MNTLTIITIIGNLAIALSLVVALVFGIVQVKTAERDRKDRLTLEAIRYFQSGEFCELIFHVSSYKIPPTMEEWRSLPAGDQIKFIQFSQTMEMVGMLVYEKYINIDLVDKTLGVFVINSWEQFKTGILDIREKQPDPFLNEYFQWLAEHLKERMTTSPRKPIHELIDRV